MPLIFGIKIIFIEISVPERQLFYIIIFKLYFFSVLFQFLVLRVIVIFFLRMPFF